VIFRYDSPDFTDSKSNPVLNGLLKPNRPRTVYAPRCLINPQCIHYQSHGGNCKLVGIASSVKSRIPSKINIYLIFIIFIINIIIILINSWS
jgi:hypothetical protein